MRHTWQPLDLEEGKAREFYCVVCHETDIAKWNDPCSGPIQWLPSPPTIVDARARVTRTHDL